MIIGGSKVHVVENIQRAILENDLNRKVEEGDAELSSEEEQKCIQRFYDLRKKKTFRLKRLAMQKLENAQIKAYDKLITIRGIENLPEKSGFIITSNHFNPLDNLCVKKLIHERYKKSPAIVIQAGNLAAPGVIGELFNYLDHIPVSKSVSYIKGEFMAHLKEALDKGQPVLIYPEEEMWFNYRKPRPNKRGAFYFASELNVPVVPCFVEIKDTARVDNEEFFESEYIINVLPPIYPDGTKNVRQNSIEMCSKDYEEKKKAYEQAYNKALKYDFDKSDIANFRAFCS